MKEFKVSREMLEAAETYMPLEDKVYYARDIASRCLSPAKTSEENRAGEELLAFPNLYREDIFLKQMLLQNILLGFYLNVDVSACGKEGFAMYDFFAASNIQGSIQRWKTDAELREKCFALLDDFREFERMVNAEIKEQKAVHNDPLARFTAAIAAGSDPETIKRALAELQKLSTAEEKN